MRAQRRPIIATAQSPSAKSLLAPADGRTTPLVGISFDLQRTLYGFRFGHDVGSAYRRCAEEFIASVAHAEGILGDAAAREQCCHLSAADLRACLPTEAEINDRFVKHGVYKTILRARVERYNYVPPSAETKEEGEEGDEKLRQILGTLSDFDIESPLATSSLGKKGGEEAKGSDAKRFAMFESIREHRRILKEWRGGNGNGTPAVASEVTSDGATAAVPLFPAVHLTRASAQTFEKYRDRRFEAKAYLARHEAHSPIDEAADVTKSNAIAGESRGGMYEKGEMKRLMARRSGLHPAAALTDDTITFGGFTASEVKEDWMGALAYVFGAGRIAEEQLAAAAATAGNNACEKEVKHNDGDKSKTEDSLRAHIAVDALAKAIYDAFLTPRPYALLPDTRRTLLLLRERYGSAVPIVAVTNNDARIVSVMDTMKLFGCACDCCETKAALAREGKDKAGAVGVCSSKPRRAEPSNVCNDEREKEEKDPLADIVETISTTPIASFNNGHGGSSMTDPRSDEEDMATARRVFGPNVDVSTLVVGDLLDFIVTPSATGAAKPHPSTLFEAIRLCGAQQHFLDSEDVAAIVGASSATTATAGSLRNSDELPSATSSASASFPSRRRHANPLIDASVPHNFKGWVHVGDHAADAAAVAHVPNGHYVKCDPTKGPSLSAIEAKLALIGQNYE